MRLTSKATSDEYAFDLLLNEKIKIDYNHTINADNRYFIIGKLLNKLGQLEDIEDELGIDLMTLFKALKNGIYDKKRYYQGSCLSLSNGSIGLYISDLDRLFLFKDYGKTWALTKEELL